MRAALCALAVGASRIGRVGRVGRAYEAAGVVGGTDTNQCSETPGGPIDGPCARGREFCGPAFGPDSPRFHIQDLTCDENDPNFPLYDPLHKLYHHFWQAHLATPPGHGPDIGHAVSADLVTWGGLRATAQ